jgi:hypothetical protein
MLERGPATPGLVAATSGWSMTEPTGHSVTSMRAFGVMSPPPLSHDYRAANPGNMFSSYPCGTRGGSLGRARLGFVVNSGNLRGCASSSFSAS